MFPVSFDSSSTRLPQSNEPYSYNPSQVAQTSFGGSAVDRPNMFAASGALGTNASSSAHATNITSSVQSGAFQQQHLPSASGAMMPYGQAFQNFVNHNNTNQQEPFAFRPPAGFMGNQPAPFSFQPDWAAFGSLSTAVQQPPASQTESFFGHLALPSASSQQPYDSTTLNFSADPFGQSATNFEQTRAAFSQPPMPHAFTKPQQPQQQPSLLPPVPPQLDLENDANLKGLRDELELINREVNELQDRYTKTQEEILQKELAVVQRNQNVAAAQSEVSSLKMTMKQLDAQKELAHHKLLELETEKSQLEQSVKLIRDELTVEEAEVKQLRLHVDGSTKSLKNQEADYNRKREELAELTAQENLLHQKLESSRIQLANLDGTLQDGTSKLGDLEEQVGRARSLNTGLEEAVRRFDAAMGRLDAADEKCRDGDNAGNSSMDLPQLDDLTESDLKLSADRFSFGTAGLGVAKFELIDPFQNLSFENSSSATQPGSAVMNGFLKPATHRSPEPHAVHDAFSTNFVANDGGSGAFSAAGVDPFATGANNSSQPVAGGSWSAFGAPSTTNTNNTNGGRKSPPPRPPAMSRVIAQTTGPAGFWSSEFDPFGSAADAAPSDSQNNTATSPTYFRGGSNIINDSASSATFMHASRTGPTFGQGNVMGGAGGSDAWDAFASSANQQPSNTARPSSRNAGGFSHWPS